MNLRMAIFAGLFACSALAAEEVCAEANGDSSEAAAAEQFELNVRPLLATTCAKCHGKDKASG